MFIIRCDYNFFNLRVQLSFSHIHLAPVRIISDQEEEEAELHPGFGCDKTRELVCGLSQSVPHESAECFCWSSAEGS